MKKEKAMAKKKIQLDYIWQDRKRWALFGIPWTFMDRTGTINVGAGSSLEYVIVDKAVTFSPNTVLNGNEKLPIVVPKGSKL